MRTWLLGVFMLVSALVAFAQGAMEEDYNALSPKDQELLTNVIELVDGGLSEAVLPDFELLAEKYPKNYLVQYERAYSQYMLGRYDEVVKNRKFLLNDKRAIEHAYQLVGNSYDNLGDSKKAVKVYQDGLKRFPRSGSLYLELGTISAMKGDYDKALEYYNHGILAQPNFASNYFRAASLFLMTDEWKVWGLVYAEAAVLLAPSNEERHEVMATAIVDCLKESIKMSSDGNDTMSVSLVPARVMQIDKEGKKVYLGFPGVYEGAMWRSLLKMVVDKAPFTGSLSQLIELRRGLVESYFSVTDDLFGNSMYLLEFQKKIIDAGHWEAYNYYLFCQCFPDEFEAWYSADSAPLDAFIAWFNNEPFSLGNGRSVDLMQIYDNYRPLDMTQALLIQASLLTDADEGGNGLLKQKGDE